MIEDNVLLITGGSTGIGAATAVLAVERGFRVSIAARSEDKLAALASELAYVAPGGTETSGKRTTSDAGRARGE